MWSSCIPWPNFLATEVGTSTQLPTSGTSIFGHLSQFRRAFAYERPVAQAPANELPLRSELFSAEQMAQYGKTLALAHRLTPRRTRDQLLPRLAANESVLIDVCERLTAAVSVNHRITPAGEWLIDNFHLIEEQIRTAKRHLPRGYSRELPRLALGPSAGHAARVRHRARDDLARRWPGRR